MHVARCFVPAVLAMVVLSGAVRAQDVPHAGVSQNTLDTLLKLEAAQGPATRPAPYGLPIKYSTLTAAEHADILHHIRPCRWIDSEAAATAGFSVLLQVVTDATGTVRMAEVAPQNIGDMSNPLYFAFTQRAIATVLNFQCATLPLPSKMLGRNQTFSFLFSS